MLTDDGKHLYVSWDEYHLLIERLALKVANSGWEFDQILCLALSVCSRHAVFIDAKCSRHVLMYVSEVFSACLFGFL